MSLRLRVRKHPSAILIGVLVCVVSGTIYMALIATAPLLYLHLGKKDTKTIASTAVSRQNMVFIPRINVAIEYKTGDASVLNTAAWHRYPERGNPKEGGNFILSAHRFELAPTPQETHRKSPFFGINMLEKGDQIYIDYDQKRYEYIVERRYSVTPDQTSIEASSDTPKMTLYSCTLGGAYDGREVIEALLADRR